MSENNGWGVGDMVLADISKRLTSLEDWKTAHMVAYAKSEAQQEAMAGHLKSINSGIWWIFKTIAGAVILAFVMWALNGGLSKAGQKISAILSDPKHAYAYVDFIDCPIEKPIFVKAYFREDKAAPVKAHCRAAPKTAIAQSSQASQRLEASAGLLPRQ